MKEDKEMKRKKKGTGSTGSEHPECKFKNIQLYKIIIKNELAMTLHEWSSQNLRKQICVHVSHLTK